MVLIMSSPFRVNNPAKQGKPPRYYSNRQEKAVAKEIGGKQTKNSGATFFQKSDVYTDLFNLECKTKMTNSDSISIKREWFEKQIKENIQMGKKYSAIVFNFGPDAPYNENHYIINEQLFLVLQEYLKESNS